MFISLNYICDIIDDCLESIKTECKNFIHSKLWIPSIIMIVVIIGIVLRLQ